MSKLGFKSVVYHGDSRLGELDAIPVKEQNFQFPNDEIRIHHLSPLSERCPPLSILQTISSFSVRCKLESSLPNEQPHLINLHASCFYELKTAVVLLGEEEIHLVAMPSKLKKFPCFWCFAVPSGLYNACLGMLNLRCLSIVFDLDETLLVANTMKSFEDRIEALKGWIARESDPTRASGMLAELKRYADDRALLKQYAETDSVVDNGKVFKVELEEVFPLPDSHEKLVRPVVRLPERNIVLTRIKPEIRDTSVLVRLRPAWEDLRSYLTAKGRKRFEVYVCTMAERDYAFEMWRLLDPENRLISLKQLLERVTCVKSGDRKSLLNVFQDRSCHPKMAMVIDDRLKVWEDKDQPRVHVVPAFSPYYAPQAETANAVPVLFVARNVACNARGGFFKEFDENLLRKIYELHYEDGMVNLPPAPDVSNYLMSEDENFGAGSTTQSKKNNIDHRPEVPQPVANVSNVLNPPSSRPVLPSEKPSLLGAPNRRENSNLEPSSEAKKRFLIVNPSQDTRYKGSGEPPLLSRLPSQLPVTSVQPQGGWLVEEDTTRGHLDNRHSGVAQDPNSVKTDKHQLHKNQAYHGTPGSTTAGLVSHAPEMKGEEGYPRKESEPKNPPVASQPSEIGIPIRQASSNGRELHSEGGKMNNLQSSLSIGVLQEIGRRCSSKVEFKTVLSSSKEVQFSVEVLFTGERIGVGMGKTRKDAQQQAASDALRKLADKYLQYIAPRFCPVDNDFDKLTLQSENGFLWDNSSSDPVEQVVEDAEPKENCSEAPANALFDMENQQVQKFGNAPRLSQSFPSKRRKE